MTLPKVLCLGEALFDLISNQTHTNVEASLEWTPFAGGAVANVAFALSKWSLDAAFIGAVGEDAAGLSLVERMEEVQIDVTGVQRSAHPTRKIYVTHTDAGERHFAGFGKSKTDDFADTQLSAHLLPENLFAPARMLVMGTLLMPYQKSRAAVLKAAEYAEKWKVDVVIDVNWREVFWPDPSQSASLIQPLLQKGDFLKFSREEAERFVGSDEPITMCKKFPKAKGIFVTDGENGCKYTLLGCSGTVPAYKINAVDTTGAGDGFLAALIYQLLRWENGYLLGEDRIREIVQFAVAVGSMVTLKQGAIDAQPSLDEISDFMQRHVNQ